MANPIIYERTIASGDVDGTVEKGVRLSNGCFARQFGTSDWNQIRVGIRYRILDIEGTGATSITGDPAFVLGFCNGTDGFPGGNSTWNNHVFIRTQDTGWSLVTNLWQIYTNTLYNMNIWTGSAGNNSMNNLRNNVGQTVLDFGTLLYASTATSSASITFFDLYKKGTEVYGGAIFGRNGSSNPFEYVSDANFITALETPSPTLSNYLYTNYAANSANNFSSSTDTYPLNTVFVYWQYTNPVVEIIDLYVSRLA